MSEKILSTKVNKLLYENMENEFYHYSHSEDMIQYEYLKQGDLLAVEVGSKMFNAQEQGCLSKDPLRNMKYLFVVNTGLCSRFAIDAGVPLELSYAISDLYIQKMDELKEIEQVKILQREMMTKYVNTVAEYKKKNVYSKPIVLCVDYITNHMNQPITLKELAKQVDLSPNYLSTLFKKEMHITIHKYIMKCRINSAMNMLKLTEYTYAEISSFLAFSSQSHFTKVFHEHVGMTPKQYRNHYFAKVIMET